MNYCHIAKSKKTGEKFLIPYCHSVGNWMHLDMPDKDLIKEYCTCDRPKRKGNEKYVEIEKDEVIQSIRLLEDKVMGVKRILASIESELDGLKSEVMMLDFEEEVDF